MMWVLVVPLPISSMRTRLLDTKPKNIKIDPFTKLNIFKKFVDESKIKDEIELNKKKNVNSKKSSFQIRLDEAMKAKQNKNKK